MAERVIIKAAPRTVLGKKVQQLRRQGRLPGNVYGRGLQSRAIDIDAREFARTIKSAGLRAMIELTIEGEKDPRYVILRGMSRSGGTGEPIHIDFFQVDPNVPIQANVPIRLVGEAPAVRDLAGTLLPALEVVAVRCLPLAIPDSLPVDISGLKSFDLTLTVGDVVPVDGVEILTDPAIVVAIVNPPRIRVADVEAEAE
ncbi:MAG: 50S ribosomal protein L25 [Chloroflexi bacterium]|nr:50S ribosomal protein L25 [Dehalococcoidia bacterium]MCO5201572.1 50S ribosomal protein L25 [Chloroflexota bacterium]MCZ7576772.1 50S ribosomal protein L25 [Dehalococcoidia bacterium]NJD66237.1 50S ribosomal protein L25 [Chloroflexota bacterium]PWB44413.1 MAG: 50S ribosomal protein L25 [Dehalococcoidia bacterium]